MVRWSDECRMRLMTPHVAVPCFFCANVCQGTKVTAPPDIVPDQSRSENGTNGYKKIFPPIVPTMGAISNAKSLWTSSLPETLYRFVPVMAMVGGAEMQCHKRRNSPFAA